MISIKEMLATDHLKRVKEFEVVKKTSTDILREIIEGIEKIDFKLLAFADYGTSIKRLAEIEALKFKVGKRQMNTDEDKALGGDKGPRDQIRRQ